MKIMNSESNPQSHSGGILKGKDLVNYTLGTDSSKSNEEIKEQVKFNVYKKASEAKTTAEGTSEKAKARANQTSGLLLAIALQMQRVLPRKLKAKLRIMFESAHMPITPLCNSTMNQRALGICVWSAAMCDVL
ncbi:hypothetical protein E3P77_04147 [Wallemia ichthyophaga]|nr:hypothetical protein E3P77_04147 [Wallemia ichthyophaga]